MQKTFVEISMRQWTKDVEGRPPTLEDIQTGALLRIANAVEAIRDFVDPSQVEFRKAKQEILESEKLRYQNEIRREDENDKRFAEMFERLQVSNLTPDEQGIIQSAYYKMRSRDAVLNENLMEWNVAGCNGFGKFKVRKFELAAKKFIAGKVG